MHFKKNPNPKKKTRAEAGELASQLYPEKLNSFGDEIVNCLHGYPHYLGDLLTFQIVVKSQDHRLSLSLGQTLDRDL